MCNYFYYFRLMGHVITDYPGKNKDKNYILTILNSRGLLGRKQSIPFFQLNLIFYGALSTDHDKLTVLINELIEDKLIIYGDDNNLIITPEGNIFISNGGYPTSFFSFSIESIKRYIKKNAIPAIIGAIGAIFIGLIVGYIIHVMGWT